MKKIRIIIFMLLSLIILGFLASISIWPPINDVETGKTPEYPQIQPIVFNTNALTTFWTAARTAKTMPLWTLTSVQQKDLRIRAEASTSTIGFVDLVDIYITASDKGSSVNVRSRSQVGKSDFGVNARRVEAYLRRLKTNMEIVAMHQRQR
tara:strand:+ start:52 stop:504 length:453 start_codon:yes stop_codon:yes gene_type:complete